MLVALAGLAKSVRQASYLPPNPLLLLKPPILLKPPAHFSCPFGRISCPDGLTADIGLQMRSSTSIQYVAQYPIDDSNGKYDSPDSRVERESAGEQEPQHYRNREYQKRIKLQRLHDMQMQQRMDSPQRPASRALVPCQDKERTLRQERNLRRVIEVQEDQASDADDCYRYCVPGQCDVREFTHRRLPQGRRGSATPAT